jgi:hypothetical protein
MREGQPERRRTPSDIRNRPPASPANFLILVVVGVLAASALAAALLGTGTEDTTPHGQVLTALQRVAEAQDEHHRSTGSYALWIESLDIEVPEDVRVGLSRADESSWEATASHPVGLTCIQDGHARQGRPQRGTPVCYTMP